MGNFQLQNFFLFEPSVLFVWRALWLYSSVFFIIPTWPIKNWNFFFFFLRMRPSKYLFRSSVYSHFNNKYNCILHTEIKMSSKVFNVIELLINLYESNSIMPERSPFYFVYFLIILCVWVYEWESLFLGKKEVHLSLESITLSYCNGRFTLFQIIHFNWKPLRLTLSIYKRVMIIFI